MGLFVHAFYRAAPAERGQGPGDDRPKEVAHELCREFESRFPLFL